MTSFYSPRPFDPLFLARERGESQQSLVPPHIPFPLSHLPTISDAAAIETHHQMSGGEQREIY